MISDVFATTFAFAENEKRIVTHQKVGVTTRLQEILNSHISEARNPATTAANHLHMTGVGRKQLVVRLAKPHLAIKAKEHLRLHQELQEIVNRSLRDSFLLCRLDQLVRRKRLRKHTHHLQHSLTLVRVTKRMRPDIVVQLARRDGMEVVENQGFRN